MKKMMTVLKKLLRPPKQVLFSAPLIVFPTLAFILAKGLNNSAPAYVIYALSAYCLTILVIPLPDAVRKLKNSAVQLLCKTEAGKKYIGDLAFRGKVSIYQGMTIDFLYAAFRAFVGIRYASVWFIAMAAYYLILGATRLLLAVCYRHSTPERESFCYRQTALFLLILNIPMGAMITLTVITDSGYSYPEYVIYLSAIYTFYTMAMAVVNIFRFRRLGSPVLSASKALSFVASLMSVLGLQTAMIAQFSAEGERFRTLMNAVTGGFVWFGSIFTAVLMLLRSRKMKCEVRTDEPLRK